MDGFLLHIPESQSRLSPYPGSPLWLSGKLCESEACVQSAKCFDLVSKCVFLEQRKPYLKNHWIIIIIINSATLPSIILPHNVKFQDENAAIMWLSCYFDIFSFLFHFLPQNITKMLVWTRQLEKMSSCHGIVHQEVRPLTAGVMVAKLTGPIDPAPVQSCDSYESDMELLHLSQKKLVSFLEYLVQLQKSDISGSLCQYITLYSLFIENFT